MKAIKLFFVAMSATVFLSSCNTMYGQMGQINVLTDAYTFGLPISATSTGGVYLNDGTGFPKQVPGNNFLGGIDYGWNSITINVYNGINMQQVTAAMDSKEISKMMGEMAYIGVSNDISGWFNNRYASAIQKALNQKMILLHVAYVPGTMVASKALNSQGALSLAPGDPIMYMVTSWEVVTVGSVYQPVYQ